MLDVLSVGRPAAEMPRRYKAENTYSTWKYYLINNSRISFRRYVDRLKAFDYFSQNNNCHWAHDDKRPEPSIRKKKKKKFSVYSSAPTATNKGTNTKDTIVISLSKILMLGPLVSLKGSPTVSPTTAAL